MPKKMASSPFILPRIQEEQEKTREPGENGEVVVEIELQEGVCSETAEPCEDQPNGDALHSKKRKLIPQHKNWKVSYIRRHKMESNWIEGKYNVKTYPGNRTNTRVRCLQFDEEKLVRLPNLHSLSNTNRFLSQVMGSFDQKTVRVLDFVSRQVLSELSGHTGGVMSLKFHKNLLLSASRDKTVKSTV